MKNEKLEIIESNEFQNLFDKSKKLIDSARSNMGQMANAITVLTSFLLGRYIIEQEQQEETGVAAGDQGTPLRSPGEEVGPHEDAGKDQVEPEDLEPAHKGAGGDRPVPQGIGVFQEPLWEQRPAEAGRRQRQGHACPEQSCRPEQGVGLGDPAPDHIHGSFSPF